MFKFKEDFKIVPVIYVWSMLYEIAVAFLVCK